MSRPSFEIAHILLEKYWLTFFFTLNLAGIYFTVVSTLSR